MRNELTTPTSVVKMASWSVSAWPTEPRGFGVCPRGAVCRAEAIAKAHARALWPPKSSHRRIPAYFYSLALIDTLSVVCTTCELTAESLTVLVPTG